MRIFLFFSLQASEEKRSHSWTWTPRKQEDNLRRVCAFFCLCQNRRYSFFFFYHFWGNISVFSHLSLYFCSKNCENNSSHSRLRFCARFEIKILLSDLQETRSCSRSLVGKTMQWRNFLLFINSFFSFFLLTWEKAADRHCGEAIKWCLETVSWFWIKFG